MAPPRTRTLGVTLSVTAISSSKQLTIIFICGYKMLLYHLVVFSKNLGRLDLPARLSSLEIFAFLWIFFHQVPKKNNFFFILIENKFALIFSLIVKKYFFASPGRFFWIILVSFFASFWDFLRFETYIKKTQTLGFSLCVCSITSS